MSGYERLATLAERELALVRSGRLEAVGDLHAEYDRLLHSLPAEPPAEAREALERAADLQADLVTALTGARDDAARELGRLRRGRGAVRAYGHVGWQG
jgi:hypothetical protein